MSTSSIEEIKQKAVTEVVTATSTDNEVEDYVAKFLDMSNEAKDNDQKEKHMSLKECIKTFPKAVMWSVILSTALIMEGYDTNLLASFFAYPGFAKKFGDWYPDIQEYQIPAQWQTGLSMGYSCGQLIGLFVAGIFADMVGYRKTLLPALVTSVGLIFIQFFAPNREVLLLSYILLGINWGSYQTITVTYASEVAPTTLRVYLTTYVNVCWVFGQLISSGVIKAISNMDGENAYRIAFAVQWIWPIPLAIGVYLAPESPWFLVKKGRYQEAKRSLCRLLSENEHLPKKEILAEHMLTKIQMTVKEEDALNSGVSIKDCFAGVNARRTRIAAFTWLVQSITGSSLMGYSTYFYTQAGLPTSMAFNFSIIQYCLGIVGTVGSWFLARRVGRFTIYFGGLCCMAVLLLLVGGLGCATSKNASWGVGSMILVYTFVYDLTIGPLCYCIVSEMPSARLRARTVMLARNFYNLAGIIVGIITPYMLNPTEWNWKAKTGFLWGGITILSIVWCWFDLPETKGRTFAELDLLFHEKVPARKFKSTEVQPFDAGKMMEKLGQEGIKQFIQQKENAGDEEDAIMITEVKSSA